MSKERVGLSCNLSQLHIVSQIKQKTAELMDLIQTVRETNASDEKITLIARAHDSYEEAARWAVKAATS